MTSTISWASNGGNTINNQTAPMGLNLTNNMAYGTAAIPTGTSGRPFGPFDTYDWQRMVGPSGLQPTTYPLPFSTEHNIVPQLWSGDSVTQATIFISVLSDSQQFPVRELLPFRKWDGPGKMIFNEWHFEPAELDVVPDEGNFRLLQHSKQGSELHFVRMARGFSMNREYMNTAEGMAEYSAKLIQLRETVMQTACLDALNAIKAIEPRSMYTSVDAQLMDLDRYHQLLIEDRNWFGVVQKTEFGMELLVNEIQSILDSRQQSRDGRVFYGCSALEIYTKYRPENKYDHLSAKNPSSMTTLGVRFVPSQPYNSEGTHIPIDPMWEEAVVGEVNVVSDISIKDVKAKDYHTAMRDTYIFCEEVNDYWRITLKQCWEKSGVVDWTKPFEIGPPTEDADEDGHEPHFGERARSGLGRHRWTNVLALGSAPHDHGRNPYMEAYPLTPLGEQVMTRYHNLYDLLEQNGCLKQTIEKLESDPKLRLALYRKLQVNLSADGKSADRNEWRAALRAAGVNPGTTPVTANPCCPSPDYLEYYIGSGLFNSKDMERSSGGSESSSTSFGPWGADLSNLYKKLETLLGYGEWPTDRLRKDIGDVRPGKGKAPPPPPSSPKPKKKMSKGPVPSSPSPSPPSPPSPLPSPRAPPLPSSAKKKLKKAPTGTMSIEEFAKKLAFAGMPMTTNVSNFMDGLKDATVSPIAKLRAVACALEASVSGQGLSEGCYATFCVQDKTQGFFSSAAVNMEVLVPEAASKAIEKAGVKERYVFAPFSFKPINLKCAGLLDQAALQKLNADLKAVFATNIPLIETAVNNASDRAAAVVAAKKTGSVCAKEMLEVLKKAKFEGVLAEIANWYRRFISDWDTACNNTSAMTMPEDWRKGCTDSMPLAFFTEQGINLDISLTRADFSEILSFIKNRTEIEAIFSAPHASTGERQTIKHWHPADPVLPRPKPSAPGRESPSDMLADALDHILGQCSDDAKLADFCSNYREELENFAAHLCMHCKEAKFVGLVTGLYRAWILVMHLLFEQVKTTADGMHIWGVAMTEVSNYHLLAIWPVEILLEANLNPFTEISYVSAREVVNHNYRKLMTALHETEKEQRDWILRTSKRFGDERKTIPDLIFVLQRTKIRDSRYFDFCIQHDVWFPMSFLLFRNGRFKTGTIIGALTGGRLGHTFIGKCDMDMGSNMHQKTIQWHLSLWLKSHVMNDKAAVVRKSVMVKGYFGGFGHEFYNPDDETRSDYIEGRMNPREKDIFCCIVPLNYRMPREYIHLNGYPDPRKVMFSDRSYQLDYPTARIYSDYWGWKYVDTQRASSNLPHACNMVMWQGHSFHFKHTGKGRGSFDFPVINKSPLGERVYPGCGKVREGHGICYQQPTYLNNTSIQLGV